MTIRNLINTLKTDSTAKFGILFEDEKIMDLDPLNEFQMALIGDYIVEACFACDCDSEKVFAIDIKKIPAKQTT